MDYYHTDERKGNTFSIHFNQAKTDKCKNSIFRLKKQKTKGDSEYGQHSGERVSPCGL